MIGLALLLLAALATAPAGAPGDPAAPPPREQALRWLAHPDDVMLRRRGAERLAAAGTMADVPTLVQALRDSDAVVRALAERALWEVWSRSGDEEVDRLLALGIEQMQQQAGEAAVATFSEVIRRRPEFAEGWNKRATVYYLLGEYQKSLADCDEVVKRNPHHFGALSGYGMIYLRLGQPARALEYFERALAINPNLHSVRETAEAIREHLIQRRRDTI